MNVPFIWAWGTWNEVEIYDTKTSQEGPTYVEGENRKRKIEKEEIKASEGREIKGKEKQVKGKMMEKVVEKQGV